MKKLMKIFKVSPKKKKILRVHVKDKSCTSPEGLQLYQKETPTWVFSCEYSKSFDLPCDYKLIASLPPAN